MNILILGNGQLGQLLGRAAIHYGHQCLLVNTQTDQVMPVSAHSAHAMSLQDAVAWADVVSWEHEQLKDTHVTLCGAKFCSPTDKILQLTDRQKEKALCDRLGIATSPWHQFNQADELAQILQDTRHALVIKAAEGGYDGRSQWRFRPGDSIDALLDEAGQQPGIAEQMIDFHCEVSIVGARNGRGEICCLPLVENVHTKGILSYTLAGLSDFPSHLQQAAEQAFQQVTDELDYVGTLAIEFFVVGSDADSRLLINEIAPRVHNSGHWSLSGTNCDQFDLHIRALTNTPFPAALHTRPTVMLNVIGAESIPDHLWCGDADPYWYGKTPRPGRKVGHINYTVSERASALDWIEKERNATQILTD